MKKQTGVSIDAQVWDAYRDVCSREKLRLAEPMEGFLRFALWNDSGMRADMIEASEFPQLVQRYDVTAVPKTVISEAHSFDGALPAGNVYMEVLKAVNPEEYRRLEEAMRETRRERKSALADEKHEYEIMIVGGGPSAMSTAI